MRNELAAAIRSGFFHLDGLPDDEDYEIADTVLASPMIRRIQAEAWDEGAEYAWQATGDGWNGEYASGCKTHDGTVSFKQANGDENPYRTEQP